MKKRVLQVLIIVGLVVVMAVFGIIQAVRIHREKQHAHAWAVEEELSRARAQVAWEELEVTLPQLHMGCASTVEDVIAMSTRVEIKEPTVNEVIDEPALPEVAMGAIYKGSGELPMIAVDAGHLGVTGGEKRWRNTGAESCLGTIEHEWALAVAWVVKDELISRGYDVYMVRDTDDFDEFPYDLEQRQNAINAIGCDVMVAIHWDSFDDKSVDGYHAIYKGDGHSPNYRLAKAISDAYGKALNGGVLKFAEPVAREDLWQLNVATMPAIIMECGFSSNESDARYLENERNYQAIADGIANGIDKYFENEEKLEDQAKG